MSDAEELDINEMAAGDDKYWSRRKTNRPKYQPLLEQLVKFAQGRAAGKHTRSFDWFKNVGIAKLNRMREEKGEEPIENDLSPSTLKEWLLREHPDLGKVFVR